MINPEIRKLLKKTKLELSRLPVRGKTGRSSPIPDELLDDIKKLSHHFSGSELGRRVGISQTRVSRALAKRKGEGKKLKTRPSFVKVIQEEVSPLTMPMKGRAILEMTTQSGMKLTIFE